MTLTTCRENKARTEVPEECCENGGLGAFDDDRRDTFMTRSPVLVRFYRSTTETGMKTKPSTNRNPLSMSAIAIFRQLTIHSASPYLRLCVDYLPAGRLQCYCSAMKRASNKDKSRPLKNTGR